MKYFTVHRNSEPVGHFSIYNHFSAVIDPVLSSSVGLLVTAVFSEAPCAQSWQMCSGTEKTRPNLGHWSETSLVWPTKQPVFLFVPHCYPSTTNNLIQPRPDPIQASVPPRVSPPVFYGLSITAQLDRDALAGL
ncbi:hypothetical protein ILYODFUR_002477 [Ilyodon furcidens]|uniref:Uncharacterized protein n=1 Tax=Ilyodon furcidens TaxID=33524 RepID=A0ABV0TT03_9TELE